MVVTVVVVHSDGRSNGRSIRNTTGGSKRKILDVPAPDRRIGLVVELALSLRTNCGGEMKLTRTGP